MLRKGEREVDSRGGEKEITIAVYFLSPYLFNVIQFLSMSFYINIYFKAQLKII